MSSSLDVEPVYDRTTEIDITESSASSRSATLAGPSMFLNAQPTQIPHHWHFVLNLDHVFIRSGFLIGTAWAVGGIAVPLLASIHSTIARAFIFATIAFELLGALFAIVHHDHHHNQKSPSPEPHHSQKSPSPKPSPPLRYFGSVTTSITFILVGVVVLVIALVVETFKLSLWIAIAMVMGSIAIAAVNLYILCFHPRR